MKDLNSLFKGTFLEKLVMDQSGKFIDPGIPIGSEEAQLGKMTEIEKMLYAFVDSQEAIYKKNSIKDSALEQKILAVSRLMWVMIGDRFPDNKSFGLRKGFEIVAKEECDCPGFCEEADLFLNQGFGIIICG